METKINNIDKNLHHVHEKINEMYDHMSTLNADDWKAEEKWEEYKLVIESMHHDTSHMKKEKEKQINDTRDGKGGFEW